MVFHKSFFIKLSNTAKLFLWFLFKYKISQNINMKCYKILLPYQGQWN